MLTDAFRLSRIPARSGARNDDPRSHVLYYVQQIDIQRKQLAYIIGSEYDPRVTEDFTCLGYDAHGRVVQPVGGMT